jgi:predicted CoA-binding protein
MNIDDAVQAFLSKKRIAVAGVSHAGDSPANAIAKRLRETDHEVFPLNPSGDVIDEHRCYASLRDIDGGVEAVVVVTKPADALSIAKDAAATGAEWIWFHQGFGPVSYDDEVLQVAHDAGLKVISAGCPMMYCCPDGFHRCARAVFSFFGRIPKEVELEQREGS